MGNTGTTGTTGGDYGRDTTTTGTGYGSSGTGTTGTGTSGYGSSGYDDNTRTSGAGPHNSSMMNKADPHVDSDRGKFLESCKQINADIPYRWTIRHGRHHWYIRVRQ